MKEELIEWLEKRITQQEDLINESYVITVQVSHGGKKRAFNEVLNYVKNQLKHSDGLYNEIPEDLNLKNCKTIQY